jgi:hypothetical protein
MGDAVLRSTGHAEPTEANTMSKARDLINAHLYPLLATITTFAVVYGVIQIAPIA